MLIHDEIKSTLGAEKKVKKEKYWSIRVVAFLDAILCIVSLSTIQFHFRMDVKIRANVMKYSLKISNGTRARFQLSKKK